MRRRAIIAIFSLWLAQAARDCSAFDFRSDLRPISENQILIKPKPGISQTVLANFHLAQKSAVLRTFDRFGHLQVLSVPQEETVQSLITKYRMSGLVEFAEPDYFGQVFNTTPNDPKFLDGTLWGLNAIEAPAGWDD